MSTATVNTASFPLLNAMYARPLLLEAHVTATALDRVIPTRDCEELRQLKSRKGGKLAKRWAPLVVHNLLLGAAVDDEGLVAALEKAEGHLKNVSGCAWAVAFMQAGDLGVPPSALIRRLHKETQKRLLMEVKIWREASGRVDSDIASWMVGAAEKIEACYSSMDTSAASVSLKKMAKFVPKAA